MIPEIILAIVAIWIMGGLVFAGAMWWSDHD